MASCGNTPQRLRGIVALMRILLAQVSQLALRCLMVERTQIVPIQIQRGLCPHVLGETLGIDAGAQRRVVLHQFAQSAFQAGQIQSQTAIFAKVVHRYAAERPLFAAPEQVSLLQCA